MSQSGVINASGGGTNVEIINADIGSATAVSNIINLDGGTNIRTSAAGNTVLVNVIGPPSPTSLTQHGVLLGNGSSGINVTSVGTTNTVLLGNTGADPSFGQVTNSALQNSSITINTAGTLSGGGSVSLGGSITLTGTGGTVTSVNGTLNQVAVANGTTAPVISLIGPYTPSTYTAHGVLIGEGTSSIIALSAGTAGQVLQSGGAASDPSYSTATYPSTAGTSGNVLTSDGTNWISSSTSGLLWSVITADQSAVANHGYICNKAGLLTLTLPATASIGDTIAVTGINTALGWKIAQNANQQIFFGTSSTTLGATGSLSSLNIRDTVYIVCVVSGASSVYNVVNVIGNITVA